MSSPAPASPASPPAAAGALEARDFVCIASGGFGDPENNRVQTMAWFRDRLYVGITRHRAGGDAPLGAAGTDAAAATAGMSRRAPYLEQPGSIWRYDPSTTRWERVWRSPAVRLRDGRHGFRDVGCRKMVVMQGPSDPAPVMYLSTISIFGSLILRSEDGERFEPVAQPRHETGSAWSYRAFLGWQRRLFASPAGRISGGAFERNAADSPVVHENPDPAVAPWSPASPVGFGDPANQTIYELGVLDDRLYAGTYNPSAGFQVWKTEPDRAPYQWRLVVGEGASRGALNQAVTSLCRGALYVGSGQQSADPSRGGRGWSGAAEIIRIHPDDSWDLVVGDRRLSFEGLRSPLSGLGPGFGDRCNGIIWKMAEHAGWLYAGTVSTTSFIDALGRSDLARRVPQLATAVERRLRQQGGFDVWRSRDGARWQPVTRTGFGNPMSFGLESMLSTPIGLCIGTVGLARGTPEWPGGCSVWLGRRRG